jgi:Holliday junction resolvasome RuvABC endonuclease subunit
MNEAETRLELIDPALKAAGWGKVENSRIRCEVIAPGRLATVYTQVGSELVSIRAEWTQTVVARELK